MSSWSINRCSFNCRKVKERERERERDRERERQRDRDRETERESVYVVCVDAVCPCDSPYTIVTYVACYLYVLQRHVLRDTRVLCLGVV